MLLYCIMKLVTFLFAIIKPAELLKFIVPVIVKPGILCYLSFETSCKNCLGFFIFNLFVDLPIPALLSPFLLPGICSLLEWYPCISPTVFLPNNPIVVACA